VEIAWADSADPSRLDRRVIAGDPVYYELRCGGQAVSLQGVANASVVRDAPEIPEGIRGLRYECVFTPLYDPGTHTTSAPLRVEAGAVYCEVPLTSVATTVAVRVALGAGPTLAADGAGRGGVVEGAIAPLDRPLAPVPVVSDQGFPVSILITLIVVAVCGVLLVAWGCKPSGFCRKIVRETLWPAAAEVEEMRERVIKQRRETARASSTKEFSKAVPEVDEAVIATKVPKEEQSWASRFSGTVDLSLISPSGEEDFSTSPEKSKGQRRKKKQSSASQASTDLNDSSASALGSPARKSRWFQKDSTTPVLVYSLRDDDDIPERNSVADDQISEDLDGWTVNLATLPQPDATFSEDPAEAAVEESSEDIDLDAVAEGSSSDEEEEDFVLGGMGPDAAMPDTDSAGRSNDTTTVTPSADVHGLDDVHCDFDEDGSEFDLDDNEHEHPIGPVSRGVNVGAALSVARRDK